MSLPEIAVRRPVATLMVFAAIALLGAVAFFRLNLDMLPDIEPPAVTVITPYPGASATDVEAEVTKYLEDQLSSTPGLDRLESLSKDNLSIVTCIFQWGTKLDTAVNDVREKIDLAKTDVAEQAKEPFLFKFSSAMVPVLVLTVTAKESTPDLYRIVDKQIADPLRRLSGVGTIIYQGGVQRQINVHFEREALEAHHLSVQQVRNVLRAENLDLPAGTAKVGTMEYQLRVAGRFRDAAEIRDLVVGTDGEALVRLRDIARVSDAHEEPTQWAWGGSTPGMVMLIEKQSGANTVNVIRAVKERLAELRAELPADIKIDVIMDTSRQIYAMIYSLAESAAVAGLLVIVVCFLFLLHFRTSLIVTLAIPLSLVVAFIAMFLVGYTINIISLMSLAIVVGMVVDDAIVVLENIVRHTERGVEPKEAAVVGAREIAMAVSASTLTIVVVFAPLFLVKGITGIIFGQLAFMVLVTILASLFVSLTLIPMASSRLLLSRSQGKANWILALGERMLDGIDTAYAALLAWALRHRAAVLTLIGALFLGSLALVSRIGTEFMPEVDSGEIEATVELPEGTRGETTAQTVRTMLDMVGRIPEAEATYGLAGQSKTGLISAVGYSEGTNLGRVGARLLPKEKRLRSAKEIAAELRPQVTSLPGVEKSTLEAVSAIQKIFVGGGRPISIEVLGHDLDATNKAAEAIRRILEQTPGTIDVAISRKKPRPEVHVRLDRDRAAALGLNVALVADALRTNYYGSNETKFREAGDDFDIQLRLQDYQRQSIREIGETPLMTLAGQTVKLRSVGSVEETFGPLEIDRKNRVRVTRVQAGLQGRPLGDVVADVKRQLAQTDLPPGISIEWGGEVEEQRKAFRDLTLLLVLGIVLVYMVMASQFEDLLDPLIIMFSVPFAFVGVVAAFVLTGSVLNLMTFMGIIILVGIVVRNAIVLVDYTKQLRRRGMELRQAITTAGKTRLRPVLMTSLTTIFGMVPLALSRGEGSEAWNAFGITVIGGLVVSGLVTLVLIPLVYSLVHGRRARLAGG
jgi:HAE1 family hydrophobic/amphiphilic exporter-1